MSASHFSQRNGVREMHEVVQSQSQETHPDRLRVSSRKKESDKQ